MSTSNVGRAESIIGEDYADSQVPEHARFSAGRVGITTGAWIIAMSTFFTGGVLADGLDFWDMFTAVLIGQIILGVIGYLTALVGGRRRLTTAMISTEVFGETGGKAIGLAIAFVLGVGWFAWQLSFFGQTIETSFGGHALTGYYPAMIWGAAITTFTVLFGFRLLSLVSAFAVPAIVGLSFYGLFLSIQKFGGFEALIHAEAGGSPLPLIKAIGLVVGNGIVGNVMFPDLARFSRRAVTGAAAAAGGYAFAGFAILLCGAAIVYAAKAPPGDLPGAMQAVGVGLPAFIILIIAQWATNKGNLYSGALCVVALTGWKQSLVVIALGFVGLMVAIAGIQDYFVPLLTFLGNFMPPVAAAMVVHKLILPSDAPPSPTALWAVFAGGTAGYLAEYVDLTFPASLVAFLTGGVLHYIITRMKPAKALTA
jgi:cytosine permease